MFIQGGSILLMHCGSMISHIIWRRVNDSDSAASHCVDGTERTAPRTTSATFAMTGKAKPTVALIQSGKGMVVLKMVTWKGHQKHHEEQQRQPGHVAKELSHEPADAGERPELRQQGQAQAKSGDGTQQHGQQGDQDVEGEPSQQKR